MEEAQPEDVKEQKESVWHNVTPLSKFLAMVLFILMPFIGGYIGYHYAPEKLVEVEKMVVVETAISTDEQNKIRLREALVDTIENRDRYIYEQVLDETNGFDPYAHNPKSRDLNINGLTLTEKSFGRYVSGVTFSNTERFENSVEVSGEFEYRFSGFDGGMWLVFKPDAETQLKLPWPSTSEEVHDWYFVMYSEDQEIISLLESYCDSTCEEELVKKETKEMLRFTGTASVSSVLYEFENVGVGSISPLIWLYDLQLSQQQ